MKKNNTLLLTTLSILVLFCIAIGVGYLIYSSNAEPKPKSKESNNNSKEGVIINKKMNAAKGLIASSNEIVDKIEKFNDLVNIDNTKKITGNFNFDDTNHNHNEYQAYFIDNSIDCIARNIEEKAKQNDLNQNTSNYNNVLKSYIEAINLDLIKFLQTSYKDAHKMNIERQIDLEDIDNLPGKFM
tara:strand:- start:297 stop:851 length:555 start_codon:yes stop_codon:yes gene_type:complete